MDGNGIGSIRKNSCGTDENPNFFVKRSKFLWHSWNFLKNKSMRSMYWKEGERIFRANVQSRLRIDQVCGSHNWRWQTDKSSQWTCMMMNPHQQTNSDSHVTIQSNQETLYHKLRNKVQMESKCNPLLQTCSSLEKRRHKTKRKTSHPTLLHLWVSTLKTISTRDHTVLYPVRLTLCCPIFSSGSSKLPEKTPCRENWGDPICQQGELKVRVDRGAIRGGGRSWTPCGRHTCRLCAPPHQRRSKPRWTLPPLAPEQVQVSWTQYR